MVLQLHEVTHHCHRIDSTHMYVVSFECAYATTAGHPALAPLQQELNARGGRALRGSFPAPGAARARKCRCLPIVMSSPIAMSFPCEAPMMVMPWGMFKKAKRLPRSDQAQGLMEFDAAQHVCVFVSHHWWVRDGASQCGTPDFQVE